MREDIGLLVKDELRAVQRDLRRKIREGKDRYRTKVEEQLQKTLVEFERA